MTKFSAIFIVFGLFTVFSFTSQAQKSSSSSIINQLPYIGEPADKYLSPAQEKKLGDEFYRNLFRLNAILQDPEIAYYMQHLGRSISGTLGNDHHTFTFFVIKDMSINAFAVPGGYIGMNAGLILASQTEHQLAGVLAHEIAHVSQRHIARQLADASSSQAPSLAAILTGVLLAISGSVEAGQALLMTGIASAAQQQISFTRSNEIEADRVGMSLLQNSEYDAAGMVEFFKLLQRKKPRINEQFGFLITHPLDSIRISEAKNRLPSSKHKKLPKPSSNEYYLVKSRLEVLANDDIQELLYSLEIDGKIKKSNPTAQDYYKYSQALESNNEYKKAINALETAIKKDPENLHYKLGLARNYIKLKNHTDAISLLKPLIEIYPDSYPIVYLYSDAHKEVKKFSTCISTLRKYHQYNRPLTTNFYKLLAECYALNSNPIKSKISLADYYYESGDYASAAYQLKTAQKLPNIDLLTKSTIRKKLLEIKEIMENIK